MEKFNQDGVGWLYTDKVKDHFMHPRNFLSGEIDSGAFNGVGEVGSPACGDMMRVMIKVKDGKITDCKWQTFGCASAIASTSVMSEMAIGMDLDEASKITAKMIVDNLGGLPSQKIHCSVLGDQALKKAIDDYLQRQQKK